MNALSIQRLGVVALAATLVTGLVTAVTLAEYGSEDKDNSEGDIVDVASGDEQFSTLVAAVKAAGLAETLKGDGPFTVFAPTNEAFAALPEGTVENLLRPENRQLLTAILTYHVVADEAKAKDVMDLDSVTTVHGSPIKIDVNDDTVMLNDSTKVTATDVEASNGVIHVIDAVLLPVQN